MPLTITEPAKYFKPKTSLDFRTQAARANALDAQADSYKLDNMAKKKAMESQARRAEVLKQVMTNPELKDDEAKLQAAGHAFMGGGDYEGWNAVQKSLQELKKVKQDQKRFQAEQAKKWQEYSTIGVESLYKTPSRENAEMLYKQWELVGNPAAKLLRQAIDSNPEATEEEIKQFALSRLPKGSQEKLMKLDLGDRVKVMPESEAKGEYMKGTSPTSGISGQSRYPSWEMVRTPDGIFYHNKFTNETVRAKDEQGKELDYALDNPDLQHDISSRKKASSTTGQAGAEGRVNLPMVEEQSKFMLRHIDEMVGSADGKIKPHPGFEDYVGATYKPGARLIEGTDAASYEKRHLQVKGEAFKEAFQSLKGGGQISNVEGEAATQALNRMDKAQNEKEYIAAARDFQKEIKILVKLARKRAKVDKTLRRKKINLPTKSDIEEEMARRGL